MSTFKVHLFLSLLIFTLVVTGCGDSTNDFIVANQPTATFTGRFDLGLIPTEGSAVEIYDSNGQLLGQTTVEPGGAYSFPNLNAPANFRAVARLSGGHEFTTEIRGFSSPGQVRNITILTTMASAYLQNHPNETLEQAEYRVRQVFHLPPDYPLDQESDESPRSIFSPFAFFALAADAGGWSQYRASLQTFMESGNDSPVFTLTREHLKKDFAGLEPTLAQKVLELKNDRRFILGMNSLSSHPVPNLFNKITGTVPLPPGSEAQAQPLILAKSNFSLLETFTTHIVDGALDQVTDDAWTHVADGLNLNYGTTAKLDAIQDSLNQMQSFLDDVKNIIDTEGTASAADDLNSDISDIRVANKDLFASRASSVNTATETPHIPNSNVTAMVTGLLGFDIQVALDTIQTSMLGTNVGSTPFLADSRNNLLTDDFGVNSGATWGNFAILNNAIVDEALQPFTYYASYQQLGANILGEISHLGTEQSTSTSPATAMNDAPGSIHDAIISVKKQRALLPFYQVGDNVFVDLQAGLMWYTVLQPANSTSGANAAAEAKSVGVSARTHLLSNDTSNPGLQPQGLPTGNAGMTYTDWHLPTSSQLESLQARARFLQDVSRRDNSLNGGKDTGVGDYDSAVKSLAALGFTGLEALNDKGQMLYAYWLVSHSGKWNLEGSDSFELNQIFEFNNGGANRGGNGGHFPYLIVRNIGEPVLPVSDSLGEPDTPYPTANWWTPIDLPEFLFLGHVTGIDGTPFPATVSQLHSTLLWTVNTGGDYTCGVSGSESQSFNLPSRSYSAGIDTTAGDASGQVLTDANDLVWYESSDPSLMTVTPSGRMYWHVDSDAQVSVDVTAYVADSAGNVHSKTTTVIQRPPVRQFLRIQIFPRNRTYQVVSGGLPERERYYCLAFYSDNTSRDVTDEVTWTLTKANSNNPTDDTPVDPALATIAAKGDADAGTFVGNVPRNDSNLRISASFGSDPDSNDSVLLELSNGVSDPDPTGH